MAQFNRDRNSGGGDRRFGGGGGGNRGFDRRADRQMFPATCSNCGNACEVPFKPTGSKPVLCSNCFRADGGGERSFGNSQDRRDDRRSFDKPRFDRPQFNDRRDSTPAASSQPQYKEQFDAINKKLNTILEILEELTVIEEPIEDFEQPMVEVEKKKKAPRKAKTPKVEEAPVAEETPVAEEVPMVEETQVVEEVMPTEEAVSVEAPEVAPEEPKE